MMPVADNNKLGVDPSLQLILPAWFVVFLQHIDRGPAANPMSQLVESRYAC